MADKTAEIEVNSVGWTLPFAPKSDIPPHPTPPRKYTMSERILPNTHLLIRLPSGAPRVIRILPDTTISLGKFGSFPSNALLYRPYHLTFDILDPPAVGLRVVGAEEVTRDILGGGEDTEAEGLGHYDLEPAGDSSGEDGSEGAMRTNKETVDDPLSQKLSWVEIEELKKQGTGSGRASLHQKTPFALQKYTLRKTKKFLRRFTVLPLTVPSLTTYLLDTREPVKILEMRNETLALMLSLANVHWGGRYLVVDESGGLLVAAIAERMGLLESTPPEPETAPPSSPSSPPHKRKHHTPPPLPTSNTITLIHPNEQPNLSLLKYFSYDTNAPTSDHPLHTHLSTINWLQLTSPPPPPPPSSLPPDPNLKASKRAAHYRKLRRTTLAHAIATQTASGSFDALLVAAFMDLRGILRHTIPLLRGSAQIVAYAQNREVVVECADCYSSARKAQWMEGRATDDEDDENSVGDPTVVLAPTLHDVRVRPWQVLPGRTHPLMTGRGGAEGVVFTGTRVLPVYGKVEARGKFRNAKKKAIEDGEEQGDSKKVKA